MKDIVGKIVLRDKEYKLYFNLNVMETIQDEYGSVDKWAELTDGASGEPNAKAVIFGLTAMINEGIEAANDDNGTDTPLLTHKQIGRYVSETGLENVTGILNETISKSVETAEKN